MTHSSNILTLIDNYVLEQIATLEEVIAHKREELDRALAANSAEVARLQGEIRDLKAQLASASARADESQRKLDASYVELANSRIEVAALQARLAQYEETLPGWTPLWDENFKTDTGWTKKNETQANDNSRNLPKNAIFGPDGLTVLGLRESGYNRPFTTADIQGLHRPMPVYHRVEVTAKLPTEFAMWPAPEWTRPIDGLAGELDTCETWTGSWGNDPRFQVALHPAYGATDKHVNAQMSYSKLPNPDPAGWHTYVYEKTKGKTRFFADGVFVKEWNSTTLPWYTKTFEDAGRPWYPRITLQIGGSGSPFTPTADWMRSEMKVSRLRIHALA